jgi:1-acyl-sn-glycerol-3-phosphate acyltransferase
MNKGDWMEEKKKLELETESKLAYLLAKIYIRIPWRKIGVKSAHTFFIERVREASGAVNVKQFTEALEKNVEVPMVNINTEIIEFLEENRPYVLNVLRKETNYIVMMALEQVDKMKEERKLAEQGQATLGGN